MAQPPRPPIAFRPIRTYRRWIPRLERVTTGGTNGWPLARVCWPVAPVRINTIVRPEAAAMRISYTPEQEELRRELRSYFGTLMTPERREALSSVQGEYGTGNVYRETVAQM